jgi:hypothetical protein
MVILPIIVIILIAIGVFLSFQKNMSNMNKIIIAVLAVLIFNIAYTYLKKTTEGFTADNTSDSYDIEEPSPDYNDVNVDEKEGYNDTSGNVESEEKVGISELVSSINFNDRIKQIQDDISALDIEAASSTPMPTPTAASANKSESFADAAATSGTISQHDVKGTGNIFNPQVIVRNGARGQSIEYSGDGGQSSMPVFSGFPSWQTPVNDLWGDDTINTSLNSRLISSKASQNVSLNGGGKCVYSDPMGQINKNISDSYDIANKNKRTCGQYPAPPESESGDIEYPYASKGKVKDKSKLYYPGYSFAPPSTWDVPQKRPPPCIPDKTRLCPMGVFDRGTPTNVLELNPDGTQCSSENECELTNIGSIMPKFDFKEIYDY